MTLHDAICEVLRACGEAMSAKEIAYELAERELYVRKNGTLVAPQQVSTRVNRHPEQPWITHTDTALESLTIRL